ncbi:MAG: rhodanese-like domain-containing protein [Saprospiraceae bacterium]
MTCKTARWKHLKSLLHNLSPEEFWRAFNEIPNARILDVRTQKELEQHGAIPNALHVNFSGEHFWEELEALDKDDVYFVCCHTGRKSLRVCTYMKNGGFSHVYNLDGGMGEILGSL